MKPDALKGASPVLNGGDEETGLVRPRLVATQLECRDFRPRYTWAKTIVFLHSLTRDQRCVVFCTPATGTPYRAFRVTNPCCNAPLQPSHVARPEAVPPGHPCGATLPHPAPPVQPQPKSRCAAIRLAAGRAGGLGWRAGWHTSTRGAVGPAVGDAGAGAAGGTAQKVL